jgi:hypothetical protein
VHIDWELEHFVGLGSGFIRASQVSFLSQEVVSNFPAVCLLNVKHVKATCFYVKSYITETSV